MKKMKRLFSLMMVVIMMLSMTLNVSADTTGYEPTESYVLNYAGVYEGAKWQYFSPYWPAFTFDGYSDYTQSISFSLYDTRNAEAFPVYCTDLDTGLAANSDFRRLNLEDSTYAAAGAGVLRSIMLNGFPKKTTSDLGAAAGVENLTVGEAVAATQAAIWQIAHGERVEFTNFVRTIDTDWSPDGTEHYAECNAEIVNGYAAEENKALIASHIEAVFNYLINLAPTSPAQVAVSNASFKNWGTPVVTKNETTGNYDVTVEATIDVVKTTNDKLTVTAILGDNFANATLENGTNNVELKIENVPASVAKGEVKLAIDGTQTVEDVFLFDAEGERGESQSLIGYLGNQLPVHAEVVVENERIININKSTKVVTGADKEGKETYTLVPLEGIIFDIYYKGSLADYEAGKLTLDESYSGQGDFTLITDADGKASVNLTKNNMPDGVYLIVERPHTAIVKPADPFYVVVPGTNPEGTGWVYTINISPKNDVKGEVDIEKDVIFVGNEEATVDAYKDHTWIIGATVPLDIADGKRYVIEDTLDYRLDYIGNVKVQVELKVPTDDNLVLTEGTDYTLTVTDIATPVDGGDTDAFTVALTTAGMRKVGNYVGTATDNYMIRVYFDAQINSNATMGTEIPNQATLEYTNSVNFDFEDESDIPVVYTGGTNLLKLDANDQTKTLPGATFKVYRAATPEELADDNIVKTTLDGVSGEVVEVKFFNTNTFTGTKVAEATSSDSGVVYISGLAYGDYYIVETQAPQGYNLLTSPQMVTITATSHLSENAVKVLNNAGFELPETGGIGTTIFTMTGLILILGAGLILVTRRRMSL